MASRSELLDIARQALAEGDEATAQAAMDAAEKAVTTADDVPVIGAGQVATPEKRDSTFADVANEAMSAVNRGGINAVDMLGFPIREPINAALRMGDVDYQIPTLRSSLADTRATVEGGQMADGLPKRIIRAAGELALPSGAIGGGVRQFAQSVTPQLTAANANAVLPNIGRQLAQGNVLADVGYGAASGSGYLGLIDCALDTYTQN